MQVDDDHVTGRSVKELEIFKAKEDKALIDLWILAEKHLFPSCRTRWFSRSWNCTRAALGSMDWQ